MKIRLGTVTSTDVLYETHYISGIGDKALFEKERIGWKISVGLSSYSIRTKEESCPVSIGDTADITFTPKEPPHAVDPRTIQSPPRQTLDTTTIEESIGDR